MSEWGRVAEDGTVYVRTADGERAVGSWHAGAPEEGMAHFVRRYEQLATEVQLLEQRLRSGVGDPRQVASSAARLKQQVPAAAAVGDLAALERRVDALVEKTAEAAEAAKAQRAEERARAVEAKGALAEEAEQLAGSSEWKAAGERLRTIGEDWKKVTGVDRKTDDELWQRVAASRKRFAERRTAHFGALEQQREVSKGRKERLVAEAEALSGSTDWRATADRYKQLMQEWKTAGRAPREVEDTLWQQFKAAQDSFFAARNAQFAAQDEEFRGNQKVKEDILAEAEKIDPSKGLDRAKAQLRTLQDRWEAAGKVPRDVMRSLEDRMGAVEQRIREAGSVHARPVESTFTVKLRERVAELEEKLAKAQAAGRPTTDLEQQLATQREWLAGAGGGAGGGHAPSAGQRKKSTTAWVRADG
ncbi:MAG: DUF349 domain-containing protein [Actinomycetota bacterium]|nr:DUF349 domain-containing protein [Actinomycetota bacterium]